jgi:hypothetical protein
LIRIGRFDIAQGNRNALLSRRHPHATRPSARIQASARVTALTAKKDYASFLERLKQQQQRWRVMGVNFRH